MVQRIFIYCYLWLNIITKTESKTTITFPSVVPVYVKSGGMLRLECQQSEGFQVVWSKADVGGGHSSDYRIVDSNTDTGFVTLTRRDGVFSLELIKEGVTPSDSGSYKCSVQSGMDMPYAVDVHVLEVRGQSGQIVQAGNPSSVGCSLVNSDIRAVIRWFKSDVELASSSVTSSVVFQTTSHSRYKYQLNSTFTDSTSESVLSVRNIGEGDVGEYTCMFELNDEYQFNHSVFIFSNPQIKAMSRSKNLAEGKTLDLTCKAWGWPVPNVTWTKEPEESVRLHDPSTSSPSQPPSDFSWHDKRVTFPANTSLRIDPVVAADRAVYVCWASSSFNDSSVVMTTSSSILVRVKGKFAPLLPLAGIVLEVIVLCVIIYMYERRRTREKAEQERKEATTTTTTTGNQSNSIAQGHRGSSSGESRHRKFR